MSKDLLEPAFCFRISKEAGMAENTDTGEPAECYIEIKLKDGEPVNREQYDDIHERLSINVAAEADMPVHYFELISKEEYDREMEEE